MPKWTILLFDLLICFLSLILAYLLRFNFVLPAREISLLPYVIPYVLLVKGLIFIFARTNAGIIRYTSTRDALRIMLAIMLASSVFSAVNLVPFYFFDGKFLIPYSIVVIDFITSTFALIVFRIIVKVTYLELNNPSSKKTNVIVFGAGEGGVIAKRAIDRDAGTKYKVLAFLDEDPRKVGKTIEDTPIYGLSELENLLKTNTVAHLILSIQKLKTAKKKQIIETCLAYNTKVLNVPKVGNWINGELSFKQIKKVNIDDLLERETIKLDEKKIKKDISGKVVLVSGAAGSIGSEIARQLANYMPAKLILLDQAESQLFYLDLELQNKIRNCPYEIVIGDIRSESKMEHLFNHYKPEYVFHAAAYKHVPLMEDNPDEAVMTNIYGTSVLADLSLKHNVSKFVMVSTDKAVNPTSVMGASKRIAEMYVQALNQKGQTRFITTRFGNVLGSNGSVVNLFRKQIENGGPVTVTHPDVTRYFMTIPEACQLVLDAGAMGQGGEIYIFDMGHSVKIIDLAKKMIKLSGLTLGKDIQIITTGLRPGEKLYEELLNSGENTMPTHHPQIMIAHVRTCDIEHISTAISELVDAAGIKDPMRIVKKMKAIVPEYKSNNSIFEQLDV